MAICFRNEHTAVQALSYGRRVFGYQFHPELRSRPLKPHPLFKGFIAASVERSGVDQMELRPAELLAEIPDVSEPV